MRKPRFTTGARRVLARSALITTGLAAIAASTGMAGPASASPATNAISTYFGGYALQPTHGVASVSTTFTVPTISCATGGGPGQSFGVWGFDIDAAYVAESAVQTYCSGTTPVYNFYILANSAHFTENGVSPGDTVVASYFETPGWTQATIHDLTSATTWVADWATTFQPASYVDVGAMSIPGNGYLAPFSSAHFSKTQVNGDYLGYQSPSASATNWVGAHHVLVSAGGITGGDGFSLTFHHSS